MKFQTIRATCTAVALTGLLGTLATAPAQAATPVGWEGAALGLSAAQKQSQGEGVTVAVLDTGVEVDHPALKGRVTTGPDFRRDGLEPGNPKWGRHGTAMASDVLKVAPKAKILSVRVLDDDNSEESDREEMEDLRDSGASPIAKGIDYAVEHGADVISMSLGSEDIIGHYNEDEAAALARAAREGVTVLASAGNAGDVLNEVSYPAGYAGVIAVAATKPGGGRADFSTVHTYNDVAAPGVDIVSANNTGGYRPVDGTSPACALAAGVVALMYEKNPKLTPAQANDVLIATTHRPPGGGSALLGYGLINADAAVKAAASPPKDRTRAVAYTGKEHLATPDGTPKTTHPELDQGLWMTGLVAAGGGLVFLIGGVLLALSGRRKVPTGAAGMVQPQGPFPR
ncbi:S8 family peptidase [Streptomyces jeddahensis]|uniref:Intracellular serine protease n=1 Tax=Streptomyces jeddahensis TaxID=1716141 RepID=A0A177HUJ4_9ACTN|nr:S8 family serine peptidase [Streptomyces jeddahensis]OAH14330.1 intracellular serine protease [Streptomyces jeddahensis]